MTVLLVAGCGSYVYSADGVGPSNSTIPTGTDQNVVVNSAGKVSNLAVFK